MNVRLKAHKATRRFWMKYAMRGVAASDNYARLELAYRLRDPWHMDSALERYRFEQTNEIIEREFPPLQTILEIGCGEGHQSQYLERLCDQLYGIDVSPTAVRRAAERLPRARFAVGDIFSLPWGRQAGSFDLVLACEVLCYVSDVERTINEMSLLGKHCLLTIFAPGIGSVAPYLSNVAGVRKEWFGRREAQWLAAFWSGHACSEPVQRANSVAARAHA